MAEWFKLGVEGEGFIFFLPDSYSNREVILGSGIKRSISGRARRDVIATKNMISLTFDYATEDETANLYELFNRNIKRGQVLKFVDDEEKEYNVIWGGDSFGLSDRVQAEDIYWSGTIELEEV